MSRPRRQGAAKEGPLRRKLLFWTAVICAAGGVHAPDGRLLQAFAVLSASLWLAWWLRGRDRTPAAAAAPAAAKPARKAAKST